MVFRKLCDAEIRMLKLLEDRIIGTYRIRGGKSDSEKPEWRQYEYATFCRSQDVREEDRKEIGALISLEWCNLVEHKAIGGKTDQADDTSVDEEEWKITEEGRRALKNLHSYEANDKYPYDED